MAASKHFEVYILNYNGARFLPDCLTSLRQLELDGHTLGVNVVDNGSSDNSEALMKEHFPEFSFIPLKKNHGFSKGNNLGVKRANKKSDFNVFLNNDTAVDKHWVLEAAAAFASDDQIGIVGSKSLFMDRFVELRLNTAELFRPSDHGGTDSRVLGAYLKSLPNGVTVISDPKRMKVIGAYEAEATGRWLGPEARILVPVTANSGKISFEVQNCNPHSPLISLKLSVNGTSERVISLEYGPGTTVELPYSETLDVIQNAGSFVTDTWDAGDLGMFEVDRGQRDLAEVVRAICGVSLFVRSELWNKLGGFDETFFAYFEDTDLSLRAQRAGFKCLYAPKSVIRHLHCGSGGEYSDYFNTTVAFSHLYFGSRYMGKKQWREKLSVLKALAWEQFLRFEKDQVIENKPQLRAYGRYLKAWGRFFCNRLRVV